MKPLNKAPQDDDASGMILVSGTDEQTQQLMMSNKVKRIATPDLLYLGMAMSKRLWHWQEMSETDFIDTVIFTLFNSGGVTLGAAYIRESNKLISFQEQPEKREPQEAADTSISHPIAIKKKENVVQVSKKPLRETKEDADISIDTPVGAQHDEQISWPEEKAEKKTSVITAADIIKAQPK